MAQKGNFFRIVVMVIMTIILTVEIMQVDAGKGHPAAAKRPSSPLGRDQKSQPPTDGDADDEMSGKPMTGDGDDKSDMPTDNQIDDSDEGGLHGRGMKKGGQSKPGKKPMSEGGNDEPSDTEDEEGNNEGPAKKGGPPGKEKPSSSRMQLLKRKGGKANAISPNDLDAIDGTPTIKSLKGNGKKKQTTKLGDGSDDSVVNSSSSGRPSKTKSAKGHITPDKSNSKSKRRDPLDEK